ncbi:MAG: glycine cleavage system aminomethyltransferase GcvT [Firmicutes bacterium]|nr:glycine cleavage system aminomethyltransferase GcvT [Bacillota bacterium]MBR3394015.1 glycine cleavage system aminomethyltransferase GcvT [Bacillota bacterium]
MERKTPLYEEHVRLGGKIVPFAGWLLPVQYSGVIAEHMAVREKCGIFDVSHMGELLLKGQSAKENLNHLLTNDYTDMPVGAARYSPMCNENGGCVDDLIVYKKAEDDYFIVVNAANKDKDYAWMKEHLLPGSELTDASDDYAQIALQGPKAEEILKKLAAEEDIPTGYYTALFDRTVDGMNCIISRTGYTGEDGFEIYLSPADAPKMWNLLLDAGKEEGLIPCGLGARDTLRLEASMPLYGHEMNDEISPRETGLGIFVKMKKEDFIGKAALVQRGKPTVKRVGLKVTGRGILREHQTVLLDGKEIGHTTSGTFCPYLNQPVAMAILPKEYAEIGTALEVDVRGRKVPVEVIALPFYKRK